MKVLVLVARGLHLGYLGCYGNDWIETPALDRLACEGIVFDQHIADQPDAAGARRAWRTGRYHFPLPGGDEGAPPAPDDDLLGPIRGQDAATVLIVDGSRPAPAEFTGGWNQVEVVPGGGNEGTPLERTLEAAAEALDRLADRRNWLLWLDLATLLPPWDMPEEYASRYFPESAAGSETRAEQEELKSLPDPPVGPSDVADDDTFLRTQRSYAAAVTYLDAGVGLLMEDLDRRCPIDETAILVTSDHGQALGEHGIVGPCRPWLHDELIHVPLILRLPGRAEVGRRVTALTQPVDLHPTLLELFSTTPPYRHGLSLFPLMRGEAEQIRAYACAGWRVEGAVEWALRTPEWALVLPLADPARQRQLYTKPDDRWEVNNLVQHYLETADGLEGALRAFVEASRQAGVFHPPPLDPGERGASAP